MFLKELVNRVIMGKLAVVGLVGLLSSCASAPLRILSYCEIMAEEAKNEKSMGWSVYGDNVFGECLSDHIGEYMLVNDELGIPYSSMGPRAGRRVCQETIPVFDNEDKASEAAEFVSWREDHQGFFEYDWRAVEITPGTISAYVTNSVVPDDYVWAIRLEETK